MKDDDLDIRWKRGQGNGGQHRNKTENCCVLTHRPTGETVTVDGRSRNANLKKAKKIMRKRIATRDRDARTARRKADRDRKIQPGEVPRIRTYDYSKGVVIDHRSGKRASIKDVVDKGHIEKLR